MIHLTRAVIRRWLGRLLHIEDSPRRTAAAYALGVFFGFSPLLGLHTALALSCAFLLNLNRVAVILGVYSNVPWIIAAYYTLATMAGATLLGVTLPPEFGAELRELFEVSLLHAEFWQQLAVLLRPLLWPYVVGSTIAAALVAAVAYQIALAFVVARRRHRQRRHIEAGDAPGH